MVTRHKLIKLTSHFYNIQIYNRAVRVFLLSSDAKKTSMNIDYIPFIYLRASILISTGKTPESLSWPVAKWFVSPEERNREDLIIDEILQASLPL